MKRYVLAEGRDPVPLEDGRDWPAQGITVAETTLYLRRRLRDRDIEEAPLLDEADEAPPADPDGAPAGDPPPNPPAGDPPPAETGRKGRKGDK